MSNATIQNIEMTTLPGSLKTAAECAEQMKGILSASRLDELAELGYMPCWIVDGRRFYQVSDVKAWLARNSCVRQPGRDYPQSFDIVTPKAGVVGAPLALTQIGHLLIEQTACGLSGVYFLIRDNEVVYVGQSTNCGARVGQHVGNGKVFERALILPLERHHLDAVEADLIAILAPKENGNRRRTRSVSHDDRADRLRLPAKRGDPSVVGPLHRHAKGLHGPR